MQNQLKQLGENMSDKFVITKVLMSLPEDYKHFISAWESAPDDKQTYDNLVARLLIEEERIKEKGQRRLRRKIHRLPYPVSNNVTSRVCEIIHADTCGPMEKPSIGGSRYFVAENETGNKIKIFRSDNGTEFINKEVREVFQNKGIIHQTSVTFTPEQNGVAERENRILVEAARTMLYAKDLPISLWAESVNTAAYVINRTGKSSIEGKSPYELWSSKSYDINNLKIFGTTVYVHIPKEKRHKWDAKGEKGIMVGYGETIKGYRVYFPQKSEVETKRDIVFVNNSPVKPIQQCETINYIEDSVEVPATVEVGAQVEDTSAAGMSSPQSPTMDGDDSQRTMQSDSEGSVYEPSDSDECGEVVRRDVDPKNKRIRKQTVFYNCNNVILVYKCDDSNLVGFCDADWEGDLRDRKSTTGYCFMYSNCLISWCSKKQSTVSLSSAESEYVAMSMAGSEACWIANVLCDFNTSKSSLLQDTDKLGKLWNLCLPIFFLCRAAGYKAATTSSVRSPAPNGRYRAPAPSALTKLFAFVQIAARDPPGPADRVRAPPATLHN
ncbi:Retrovirus-related Pol polyprotein from transposon TNT 1-94 [Eumeta japonica]|uniref:Retrovirus-related Pol polyprotein from transposon TNT 1-94 n=1 Tax=Eumeta variegata TaxID=151549 RepID=A0A4C1S9D9_EUMVA|nr:Retrovirus-related Pol polyprotein from transposon TNT 1-94 [Eumeta japonica]